MDEQLRLSVLNKQLRLLAYDCDRSMVRAYAATGRLVWIERSRQGNVRMSLNGGRRLCVRDGLAQIERCIGAEIVAGRSVRP